MIATDRTAAPDAEFHARVTAFDAAPPVDLAADARVEIVARAMKVWDGTTSSDSSEEWFRGLAAAAIAADDAWRAEQVSELRGRLIAALRAGPRFVETEAEVVDLIMPEIAAALRAEQ